jgi:hypothetical protein
MRRAQRQIFRRLSQDDKPCPDKYKPLVLPMTNLIRAAKEKNSEDTTKASCIKSKSQKQSEVDLMQIHPRNVTLGNGAHAGGAMYSMPHIHRNKSVISSRQSTPRKVKSAKGTERRRNSTMFPFIENKALVS